MRNKVQMERKWKIEKKLHFLQRKMKRRKKIYQKNKVRENIFSQRRTKNWKQTSLETKWKETFFLMKKYFQKEKWKEGKIFKNE